MVFSDGFLHPETPWTAGDSTFGLLDEQQTQVAKNIMDLMRHLPKPERGLTWMRLWYGVD